ncbi:MAG: C40 family peptidase [Mailhella sp.]|nr:C40 family peptidase [Mailhella sp.]
MKKRSHVSLCLILAFALCVSGCSLFRRPQPPVLVEAGAHAGTVAEQVVQTAQDLIGSPYRYGGTTPRGFDCSGFVQFVFSANDIRLPRTSGEQARVGRKIARSDLRPGDILVFRIGIRSTHTGIYVADNTFIHSPSRGGKVRYDAMDQEYWDKRFLYGRRIPGLS